MIDLNSLLPAGSGWVLESADAINDAGQIVGYGSFNGVYESFLLDTGGASAPEPASLALGCAGAAFFVLVQKRLRTGPN
jgi:hypothetical protein